MNTNVLLIFKRLEQPAQTVRHRRLLRHRALFKQRTIARVVIAHDDVQLVNLATGALDKIDMPRMQGIKLAKYHTNIFLLTWEFQIQEAM